MCHGIKRTKVKWNRHWVHTFFHPLFTLYLHNAHKKATLHSMESHARELVKLQEVTHSPIASMRKDKRSRPGSSRSSRHPKRITPMIAIIEDEYSPSSSSEGEKQKRGSRFKRQKWSKKLPTTVALNTSQQRAHYNRAQKNAGLSRLCFTKRLWSK